MNVDEDLNESDLFCKSLIQKRKPVENVNSKNSKQLKLNFTQISTKTNKEQIKDGNNSVADSNGVHKNQDSKFTATQSSYFHLQRTKNTCPLCLKSFKTDSMYSAHMKQCAKTHKMTTQQLLAALEVQKKQMQERRDFGLSLQSVLPAKKSTSKKRIEKDIESYDLALGLALSKSLAVNDSKITALPEAPRSTLKEFGFTSTCSTGIMGSIKRKLDSDKKSLLRERTEDERQRLIIEKVAVVLLDEDIENKETNQSFSFHNCQGPKLWSKGQNNGRSGWYVDKIKSLVLLDKDDEEKCRKSAPDNIANEIAALNLPQKDISNDWRKIINNKNLSDFVGKTADGQDVHMHLVVLYARCPQLLEKDYKSIFEKFESRTVLIFMEYIYCGTLNGLLGTEIDNLCNLASEFEYKELIEILSCLKNNLSAKDGSSVANLSQVVEPEEKSQEISVIENKKVEEEKDALTEADLEGLSQKEYNSEVEENGDSSNIDKSYWSFIQHEKKIQKLDEMKNLEKKKETCEEEKADFKSSQKSDDITELRRLSQDSSTKDWNEMQKDNKADTFSDCVILSSGSETKSEVNFIKSSKTPSPILENYEAPLFDPYDNFHCFSEEPFSPVGLHSQSLITGDISVESLKENVESDEGEQGEMKTVGYCSTPVTISRSSKAENSLKKSRRGKRDLSASRLLRKSLNLHRTRKSNSSSFKKKLKKGKKSLEEALTNSLLHELSKCSTFDSPSPRAKNFVEITPTFNKEEFADSVTPSPNYSNMGETLLKEQLSKYGLKKNLAKSKARKILRLIYEELHPLYDSKTGKLVKKIPRNTPKRSRPTGKSKTGKNGKTKTAKEDDSGKKIKTFFGYSKESENLSDESGLSFVRCSDKSSDGSDFESLNETLTQSLPTSPVDLPSAFSEFLQNNPEYHQKILLYEPIWLEELQKELKGYFKKHFKMSDLMLFLDQKCIAFRSAAQTKKLQERYAKKKESSRRKKIPSE